MLSEFANALLDVDKPLPEGVCGPDGKKAEKRFAVYRNNVVVSLIDGLEQTFPAIQRLVGDKFFRGLCGVFVRQHPPTSPLMFEYGRKFPSFLGEFEEVKHLRFLPDVARLELLWLDAYHSADSVAIEPEAMGQIAPEALADVCFLPAPSSKLFKSNHAATSIYTKTIAQLPVDDFDPHIGEACLITRKELNVEIRQLPLGGYEFLSALFKGENLGTAASAAQNIDENFNLMLVISTFLEAGVFIKINEGKITHE